MKTMLLAAAISVAAIAAPASALVNAGFETGNTAGWSNFGGVSATTSYSTWTPYAGNYFAVLSAGLGAGVYSTLSQSFTLAANQTIKGAVGFQANDYLPFNDDAYLTIGGSSLFTSSVAAVGDYGNTGWQTWSYTAPTAGTYTLELGVRNVGDNGFTSVAMLDSTVPEPQSWALMIIGFGLVGATMRRRKGALAA